MLLRPPPAVATRPAFARAAPSRARLTARSAAAAAGGSGSAEYDPYKVLGVHPLAGADEFSRARARQVRDATARGDEATAAAAEAAYDAVMMRQLALRMKGQGPLGGVAALLPAWAPKRAALEGKELGMNAVLALACLSWSLMHPSPGLQPMTVAMTLFFFRMNSKMLSLFPSPSERESKVKHEAARMLRTIGLVLGALSAAIFIVVGLPTLAGSTLSLPLPAWLFIRQEMLVNVSTILSLFVITSFFR